MSIKKAKSLDQYVQEMRAFNRYYTDVIGVLNEGILESPYSLTEARVLYELAQRESTEVAHLRDHLRLDAGYLSRLLARFQKKGLIRRRRSREDGRRQNVELTPVGEEAFIDLDRRSAAEARSLLVPLAEEDRRRLLGAMNTVRGILEEESSEPAYLLRSAEMGDFGWVVYRHGVLYAHEYGWDARFEALVARVVADYVDHKDPKRYGAWIAEKDGERVGCVFCMPNREDETVAQLRLLLVEPKARGSGIGSRLVKECLRFARRAGYREMVLWTNDVLDAARRIYEESGFELVEEKPHDKFGDGLIGQTWRRVL